MLCLLFDRSLPLTGGVARSFIYFGAWRDRDLIDLHAVSCQKVDVAARAAFAAVGMAVHDVGDAGYARPVLALRRVLQRYRPAVVLCCSFKPYVLACAASAGLQVRVVFWHVAITDILAGRARTMIYRGLARRRDVLANSHASAAAAAYPGHRGRTRIVHLGVPDGCETDGTVPAAAAARPALLGVSEQPRVIGYVAGFVAYKRHDVLIDAFAQLAAHRPDLHLVLVGVGPGQAEMQARAASVPGGERIHFTGARDDVRRLLGTFDIYAHPAVGEGFGLAVVEAMLAERPVVAAHAGALPELVDGQTDGMLCAPGDAAAWATCLARLLDDPDRRRTLGEAARATALARFTPETYASGMTEALTAFSK